MRLESYAAPTSSTRRSKWEEAVRRQRPRMSTRATAIQMRCWWESVVVRTCRAERWVAVGVERRQRAQYARVRVVSLSSRSQRSTTLAAASRSARKARCGPGSRARARTQSTTGAALTCALMRTGTMAAPACRASQSADARVTLLRDRALSAAIRRASRATTSAPRVGVRGRERASVPRALTPRTAASASRGVRTAW